MFSNTFLRSFRILLLPFALLYWVGIAVRNWAYDVKLLRSTPFGLPVICVGNLSVGGTGKSPMVEYLIYLLRDQFRVATVSRGYKRKTRGYALAGENSTALDIGDEPMQFHLKFPDIPVAVGEERLVALPQLLHDRPSTEVIVLDDAFQHRAIRAGLNILLTDHANLFTRDFYLPAGNLRDLKSQYRRAEIIVVTKCPPSLSEEERQKITREINPVPGQSVFFTTTCYGDYYHILGKEKIETDPDAAILLVTGIANPRPLKNWLEEHSKTYQLLQYSDHHIYSIDDLREIRRRFDGMETSRKIILTTEKDAVRLIKFRAEIKDWPLYVIPVRHDFLFNETEQFNRQIIDFIRDLQNERKT